MKSTKKQKTARARNWNKRMISGATYSLKAMCSCHHMAIGLTDEEKKQIAEIYNQIHRLLMNWRKSI